MCLCKYIYIYIYVCLCKYIIESINKRNTFIRDRVAYKSEREYYKEVVCLRLPNR